MVDTLLGLISAGNWMGLAILLLSVFQTWMQPTSGFPWNPPEKLQVVITTALGQLYAVLLIFAAHQAAGPAIVHGVIATLLALLTSHAIWENDNAPTWVKAIVFALKNEQPPTAKRPPGPSIVGATMALVMMVAFLAPVFVWSCTKQQTTAIESAGEKAGVCVLDAELQAVINGHPVDLEATALKCAIAQADVISILEAEHKVSNERLKAGHCAGAAQ